jgi:hypothetical protein
MTVATALAFGVGLVFGSMFGLLIAALTRASHDADVGLDLLEPESVFHVLCSESQEDEDVWDGTAMKLIRGYDDMAGRQRVYACPKHPHLEVAINFPPGAQRDEVRDVQEDGDRERQVNLVQPVPSFEAR